MLATVEAEKPAESGQAIYILAKVLEPTADLSLMRRAGEEFGLIVDTISREGQKYFPDGTDRGLVQVKQSYVKVLGRNSNQDLTGFWDTFDDLKADRSEQRPKTYADPTLLT